MRTEPGTELDAAAGPDGSAAVRPMRKDAARNRELILSAARDVFARRGLEASLDDVAHQAGVGVGTAYRHFGNKYDLATAVAHETIGEIVEVAERATLADDPWAGLVDFLEAALELQTRNRGLREVMMGVRDPGKSDEAHDRIVGPVTALLERAQAAGVVRPDIVPSDLGFVVMMLCQVADIAGELDPDMWRRYLPILLAGLRPDGPPLGGEPFSDEQFRAASAGHLACRLRATRERAQLT